MSLIKEGQRIRISIEGSVRKVTKSASGPGSIVSLDVNGEDNVSFFTRDEWKVEVLEDSSWPPIPGDTWRVNDDLFVVYKSPYGGTTTIAPVSSKIYDTLYDANSRLNDFKRLKPVLVFRPEVVK